MLSAAALAFQINPDRSSSNNACGRPSDVLNDVLIRNFVTRL
jgi:hypothetical protein